MITVLLPKGCISMFLSECGANTVNVIVEKDGWGQCGVDEPALRGLRSVATAGRTRRRRRQVTGRRTTAYRKTSARPCA
jgi:hypothetical protein